MGIQADAYIMFGWVVKYEKLVAFCDNQGAKKAKDDAEDEPVAKKAKGDAEDEDDAGDDVDERIDKHLPHGLTCYRTSPSLCVSMSEDKYFLALLQCEDITLSKLCEIESSKAFKDACKFMNKNFDIADDPQLFASLNIFY